MSVESLSLVGVDHHRTPVDLRERLAVSPPDMEDCLRFLSEECQVAGAIVLSTCNRTEYYLSDVKDPVKVIEEMALRQGVEPGVIKEHTYCRSGESALSHLFEVVASLHSMVIGEYQIMHQVKFAYEQSRLHRKTTPILNRIFQKALAVGKEVRNDTGIGKHKLSTASIAVDLARAIHGDLKNAHLLLTGAGDMADLALQHFMEHGVRRVTIINRNKQRAEDLAQKLLHDQHIEVQVRNWNELASSLSDHDIVLSSTASPVPVIRADDVHRAMAKRRDPLMLIDLAVPRDIAPEASEIDDTYLYNIDALEQVAAKNRELRSEEVDAARDLVKQRVTDCIHETAGGIVELRRQIAHYFDDSVASEAKRLGHRLGFTDDHPKQQEVTYGMQRMAKKMQHQLLSWLRDHADEPESEQILRSLLGLNGTEADDL